MLSLKMASSDALVFKLAMQTVIAMISRSNITKNRKHFLHRCFDLPARNPGKHYLCAQTNIRKVKPWYEPELVVSDLELNFKNNNRKIIAERKVKINAISQTYLPFSRNFEYLLTD